MANKNHISKEFMADSQTLVIIIEGEFTYDVGREFRQCYENASENPDSYIIDLSKATFIDSAGLGMLVAFRDYFSSNGSNMHLVGAEDQVLETLQLSNFQDLFSLSDPRA